MHRVREKNALQARLHKHFLSGDVYAGRRELLVFMEHEQEDCMAERAIFTVLKGAFIYAKGYV